VFPVRYELNIYILFGCVWSGLEYLHRSPASRERRSKGNSVPGDLTGLPCSWGT
jgi:hypothetical protein